MIIIKDFKIHIDYSSIKSFCETYALSSLTKEPTCYKIQKNPSCTEPLYGFQNPYVIKTGL